jgi:superfamily II DNA or RNA helicase/uncharacterized protein (DUF3820 family)
MQFWPDCERCGYSCDNGGKVCNMCLAREPKEEPKPEPQVFDAELPPRKSGGKFTPRPYQVDACRAAFGAWNEGKRNILLEMATGLGKTVVFSEICLRWPEEWGRVLILAHRTELIEQACHKVGEHMEEMPDVEKAHQVAQRHRLMGSDVVVASVQTITQRHRLEKFYPEDFGLIITDEAHHATSKSYRRIFNHFMQNPSCKMLGVTATPERADKAGLIHVYDGGIVYSKPIKDGIDDGYLVPIQQGYPVIEGLDFSLVRQVAGDFQKSELEKMMMGEFAEQAKKESPLLQIASVTVRESDGRPTLVFCVTKKHALAMTEIFCRYPGVKAECVIDDTPPEERARIIENYKRGETQILCGVGVFTEGFDAPLTELVVIARPTKSLPLYIQMVGRGTRPMPGVVDGPETPEDRRAAIAGSSKPFCRILDFVGVSGRHSLVSSADIYGGDPRDVAAAKDTIRKKGGFGNIQEEIEKAKQARFEQEEARRKRLLEQRLIAESRHRLVNVDPFGGSMGQGPGIQQPKGPRGTASDKQVDYLVNLGIARATAETFSKEQAGKVISERKALVGAKYRVSFGKYKGRSLGECPNGYVDWVKEQKPQTGLLAELYQQIQIMEQGREMDREQARKSWI